MRLLPRRLLDTLQVETYERRGAQGGFGFGLYGQKRLRSSVAVGAGYARIDRGGLNSDRFPRGRRIYATAHAMLAPRMTLALFASRALGQGDPLAARTRSDLGLSYDVRHLVHAPPER